MKKFFGITISTGSSYHPVAGWDSLYTTREDAEACATRAQRNDGWSAKVVSMTAAEAAASGWIEGLNNDARYHDLRRSYGDGSREVSDHLERCIAVQARGENHT